MRTTVTQDAAPVTRVVFAHRALVVRRAGFALRWNLRTVGVCALLASVTLVVTVWALASGDYHVSLGQVWGALTGDSDVGFARTVVVDWRLPRALAAIVFGAALGASGAVFQSLTRNPLAGPDVIGFTTGSYTGALIVIIVTGGGYLAVAGGALAGGVITAAVVYLLAWQRGVSGFRLIIVGIAVSAMLSSLNTWLMLRAKLETAMSAAAWGAGSLTGTSWSQVTIGGFAILALLIVLALLVPALHQLELGDDAAKATGTRAEPARLGLIVTGVALTATVTAAAGPIAFVALAAPQIARRLVRSPGVTIVPAAFTGALVLVVADFAAQHALSTAVPVGVVTVVIGGGYLIWLLIREIRVRT